MISFSNLRQIAASLILLSLIITACSTENKPTYTLNTNVEPSEAGTIEQSTTEAVEGESISITLNPNEHWRFVGWNGDITDVSQKTFNVFMDQDRHITALLEKVEYPLIVDIYGEGSVEQELIQAKDTTDYEHGSLVRLTAHPEEGWEFVEWAGDGINETNDQLDIQIDGEISISATFKLIDYELTIDVVGEGVVEHREVSPKIVTEYPHGTYVELHAKPSTDWMFFEWSDVITGNENPTIIEILDDTNIVATFITRPEVSNLEVGSVTESSASVNAEVKSSGGNQVTKRGFCWGTSPNPSHDNAITCSDDGNGIGSFGHTIDNLNDGTTYYVRAYATNAAGTNYTSQESFETDIAISAPDITTNRVSSVTTNSAQTGGNISSDGGASVTQRGVCWSTSRNPTTNNACTNDGTGVGDFSSSMTGLSAGTRYYVRAYAINSQGVSYGNERNFDTKSPVSSGETVTDRDGNVYPVVQIGNQKWMASNLRTTRYQNGDRIRNETDPARWASLRRGAWAYYDNNASYDAVYGKLYNWHAVNDRRGICPAGWRVPSDNDFKALEANLGMPSNELDMMGHRGGAQNVGGKLKTTGNDLWREPITDPNNNYYNPDFIPATNESGFSGVPSGNLNALDATHAGPGFYSMVRDKDLWTSTPNGIEAYIRALSFNQSSVYRDTRAMVYGLAVRCVR